MRARLHGRLWGLSRRFVTSPPLPLWLNAFAVELGRERPDIAFTEVDRAFLEDLHRRGVSPSDAVCGRLPIARLDTQVDPNNFPTEDLGQQVLQLHNRVVSFSGPRYRNVRLMVIVGVGVFWIALALALMIYGNSVASRTRALESSVSTAKSTTPSQSNIPSEEALSSGIDPSPHTS